MCSSVWPEFSLWKRGAVGSNPTTLTILIFLLFTASVSADVHIEYVDKINHELLIDIGFKEIEPGVYKTYFNEYDKNGKFIKVSELYIIEKVFYVFYRRHSWEDQRVLQYN